jgi:hypothetical protein
MKIINQGATTITLEEEPDVHPVAQKLYTALDNALNGVHKLPSSVLGMHGMSGWRYRYFINNFTSSIETRYLEVGSWAGSTACAAMHGNALTATCIDNWSQFGGPKEQFQFNIESVMNSKIQFRFIENDFRVVDYKDIGKYNVYLFDGPHSEIDQYDGIKIAQPALDDFFVLIVDDWNWPAVRKGTTLAIKDCNLKIVYSIDLRTTQDDSTPTLVHEKSEWHNGYYIALCAKQQ